jgi:Holliday junction DNA helicase RuvA
VIASVAGRVSALSPSGAVLEVGGIGLELSCTPATLAGLRVGEQVTLAASLVVREDSLSLFGFADADERSTFEILQTATGVGPRLAQAVLAVLSPEAVRAAVAGEDLPALMRVPGIGRKGAQRIVLELKDRLAGPALGASAGSGVSEQVRAGLLELGYSAREADDALAALGPATGADAGDVGARLRAALSVLRRR